MASPSFNRPDHLDRFGGVYCVTVVPEELRRTPLPVTEGSRT
jgi:hypothetical protein